MPSWPSGGTRPGALADFAKALFVIALAAGLICALLWKGWQRDRPPAPSSGEDAIAAFATPYRNTRPEVAYVSDAVCADCHAEQAEAFRSHPMGRSITPIASLAASQRYDAAVRNPFEAVGGTFAVEHAGERVFHKETRSAGGKAFAEAKVEVNYVIGSGIHNYSYLIDQDGVLTQSGITFYSQKGIWDLSPGFANQGGNYFDRPVTAECLFCHANRVEVLPGALNHYRQPIFQNGLAIGCQRCHGPGELHVARHERGDPVEGLDDTIVNPRRLPWELREAVCQQCHLEGVNTILKRGRDYFDYRPGLPWQMFWSVFVRSGSTDEHRFDSSVEQLYASRCFQASKGRMGCITCHDPHRLPQPAEKVAYYRGRCLTCHEEQTGCKLAPAVRRSRSQQDDCIACHMPPFASSDIPHTAATDHRILRKPGRATASEPAPPTGASAWRPFLPEIAGYKDEESARVLALFLIDRVKNHDGDKQLLETAMPLVNEAVRARPEDLAALEAKAEGLALLGQTREGLAIDESILARAPGRETTLVHAAMLARALGAKDAAIAYRQRLLAINPSSLFYQEMLANALAERGDWQQAVSVSEAILRQYPPNLKARLVLLNYYVQSGDRQRARSAFEQIIALHPRDEDSLRRWFEERMK
jgi:Doubled CXXCH motif (Paired_CXXCH_1)